ncbi:hypothetical protein [Amycolatopsis sacchari]|uniref:hypothetical protein n=1 Tax=Amycolatopsis sacchari TaxID=115433 RepID=UPI003EBD9D23
MGPQAWLMIKTHRRWPSEEEYLSGAISPVASHLAKHRDARVLPALRWLLEQEQLPGYFGDLVSGFGRRRTVAHHRWRRCGVPVLLRLWRTNLTLVPELVKCLAEMGTAARPAEPLIRAEIDSPRRYSVQSAVEYFDALCDVAADEALLRHCRSILADLS